MIAFSGVLSSWLIVRSSVFFVVSGRSRRKVEPPRQVGEIGRLFARGRELRLGLRQRHLDAALVGNVGQDGDMAVARAAVAHQIGGAARHLQRHRAGLGAVQVEAAADPVLAVALGAHAAFCDPPRARARRNRCRASARRCGRAARHIPCCRRPAGRCGRRRRRRRPTARWRLRGVRRIGARRSRRSTARSSRPRARAAT